MSGHYVCTSGNMLGHLGNMLRKCLMSNRYFKLCTDLISRLSMPAGVLQVECTTVTCGGNGSVVIFTVCTSDIVRRN